MKKNLFSIRQCLSVAIILVFSSCTKDVLYETYTYYEPVMQSKSSVINEIKSGPAMQLQTTGKIVKYGNYIFLNELNKGVHVIDNTDPTNPTNKYFINIPGNIDIALKDNTLYADIYTDLIVMDISSPENIAVKKVISYVFTDREYQSGTMHDSLNYVTGWAKKTTTDKTEYTRLKNAGNPVLWFSTMASTSQQAQATIGVSGSMARFTIVNNYLYTVGQQYLTSFNISSTQDPVKENKKSIGWNIETIYPFKDKLFIGSQTGMFIYSLASPANPTPLGIFSHACFRDPVIADDNYAYVTLRATTNVSPCWGAPALQRNELDVININNLQIPILAKIYDMVAPQGLSKDGDLLFICDNAGGLKIFNASSPINLQMIKRFTDIKPFDVIAQNNLALVVAESGIYQYDYSDVNNIRRISKISIEQ